MTEKRSASRTNWQPYPQQVSCRCGRIRNKLYRSIDVVPYQPSCCRQWRQIVSMS